MAVEVAELDKMQSKYKAAVDAWIEAIRAEEALASASHSETEIDRWEAACYLEDEARNHARAAKKTYEDALREEFFGF